jgi:hypothetical protein
LYCEGPTDNRFLPPIIEKTARYILDALQLRHVSVSSLQVIEVKRKKRPESILKAAQAASGYDVLIVHADADYPKSNKARNERFDPGLRLVQQTNGYLCKCLVPIIPIQAIESWMMADYKLLLSEIGTKLRPIDLGIPENAIQVESISKPKLRLKSAVHMAYASRSKRHRQIDIDFLYEPLGQSISMERLKQVPSYQQFVNDLTEVLTDLYPIPQVNII